MDSGTEWSTCIHEAGHAVIGLTLGLTVFETSIIPDEDGLGHCVMPSPLIGWSRGDGPRRPLGERFIVALMAGAEAERELIGISDDDGDCTDRERIRATMIEIVRYDDAESWWAYEGRLRNRTRRLVAEKRNEIRCVAQALAQVRMLTGAEIKVVISSAERWPYAAPDAA